MRITKVTENRTYIGKSCEMGYSKNFCNNTGCKFASNRQCVFLRVVDKLAKYEDLGEPHELIRKPR